MDKCPFCGAAKVFTFTWTCGTSKYVSGFKRDAKCYEAELATLNKLVREMVPHLKYLANIPYMDTVSWAPGKQTKRAINALLNCPEVKKILEAK